MPIIKALIAIAIITIAASSLAFAKYGGVHTIQKNVDQLESLIADMPFVSAGVDSDKVIYKVSFRDCPACVSYHRHEFPKLRKLGVDTRQFVFAPPSQNTKPQERAVVAELYKNRNWQLLSDWFEVNNQQTFYDHINTAPPADGNRARIHAIAQGQEQYLKLAKLLEANMIPVATPIILWEENGQWNVVIGNNPLTNARIRKAFHD